MEKIDQKLSTGRRMNWSGMRRSSWITTRLAGNISEDMIMESILWTIMDILWITTRLAGNKLKIWSPYYGCTGFWAVCNKPKKKGQNYLNLFSPSISIQISQDYDLAMFSSRIDYTSKSLFFNIAVKVR